MHYDFYQSPIGVLYLQATTKGISSIELIDEKDIHSPQPSITTDQGIKELKEYFEGKRKTFTVPVDISSGTDFQRAVWKKLSEIPYGSTTTYLEIAHAIHNPLSVRAVGMANGKNPIPIILPCHRVIGSNGSLVGYALGLDIKKKLLMHENPVEFGEQATLF